MHVYKLHRIISFDEAWDWKVSLVNQARTINALMYLKFVESSVSHSIVQLRGSFKVGRCTDADREVFIASDGVRCRPRRSAADRYCTFVKSLSTNLPSTTSPLSLLASIGEISSLCVLVKCTMVGAVSSEVKLARCKHANKSPRLRARRIHDESFSKKKKTDNYVSSFQGYWQACVYLDTRSFSPCIRTYSKKNISNIIVNKNSTRKRKISSYD